MDRFKIYHEEINIMLGVLEDDEDFKRDFEQKLREKGLVNFHMYPSGEALIRDMTLDFHVVVLDHLGIGAKNGLEVMKEILKINEYAFVIVYSAQKKQEVVEDYLNNGAYAYINKNRYSPKEAEALLLSYIDKALETIQHEVVFFAGIDKQLQDAKTNLIENDNGRTDNG